MPPHCPGDRNATHNQMLAERPTLLEAHAASVSHVKVYLWVSRERRASLHTAVGVSGAAALPKSFNYDFISPAKAKILF